MSFKRVVPKLQAVSRSLAVGIEPEEKLAEDLSRLSSWARSLIQYLTNLITDLEVGLKTNLEYVSSTTAVELPSTGTWIPLSTVNFTNTGLLVRADVSLEVTNTEGSPTAPDLSVRLLAVPNGLGLLLEPEGTNICLRSEELDVSPWVASNATITIDVVSPLAPDGTATAEKFTEVAVNTVDHGASQSTTTMTGNTYIVSAFAHAAERDKLKFHGFGNGSDGVVFDLTAKTTQINGTWSQAVMEDVGGGWFRCSAKIVPISGNNLIVGATLSLSGVAYLGDITKGLYVWGVQVELSEVLTSYIKTEGIAATRPADTPPIDQRTIATYANEQDITGSRLLSFHAFDTLANDTDRTAYTLECKSTGDALEVSQHLLTIEEQRTRL